MSERETEPRIELDRLRRRLGCSERRLVELVEHTVHLARLGLDTTRSRRLLDELDLELSRLRIEKQLAGHRLALATPHI